MFLNPLGLLGLASLVPLIVLYIIRPDPRNLEIPTVQFLPNVDDEGGSNPVIESIRRNLILFLQILALILVTLALASPFVTVPQGQQVGETIIVLDTSASMATSTGGSSRFQQAVSEAKSSVTSTTSILTSGASTGVELDQGDGSEASRRLDRLSSSGPTAGEGDLRTAISRASSMADVDSRIVVLSDFADDTDWRTPVDVVRASGTDIQLKQFDGGGGDNVGIVGMSFGTDTVTATVKNYADTRKTGSVTLGNEQESFSLNPGGVSSNLTFQMPSKRSKMTLSPSDSFGMDNQAFMMGYNSEKIDVLLLSTETESNIRTALEIQDNVRLVPKTLPIGNVEKDRWDVVVFTKAPTSSTTRHAATVGSVKEVVQNGGGVVIQAQKDMSSLTDYYGDLLLIEPEGMGDGTNPTSVSDDRLIEGLSFPPVDSYVRGSLRNGSRSLVNATDNSPMIALSGLGGGQIMYYGFMRGSDFSLDDRFPIFWMRAMNHLAGRETLSSINRRAGQTWSFPTTTQVITPQGSTRSTSITLSQQGYYQAGSKTISVNLRNPTESNVTASDISEGGGNSSSGGTESSTAKQSLTPIVAGVALLVMLVELGVMKFRGDV